MSLPEYDSIHVSDPRFGWVIRRFGHTDDDDISLAAYLKSNSKVQNLEQNDANEFTQHLHDYISNAHTIGLDEELVDIGTSIGVSCGRLEAILRRIGWLGNKQLTLEETGQILGITRERVRQIESQFLKKLQSKQIWTPRLRGSINQITELLPIAEARFSEILQTSGVTRMPFSLKGYLRALELFDVDHSFEIIEIGTKNWLSSSDATESNTILKEIRTHAIKLTSQQGICNLDEVNDELGREDSDAISTDLIRDVVNGTRKLTLVDNFWVIPSDLNTRNSLRNRLRKILAVTDRIEISHARELLEREERPTRSLDITDSHIAKLSECYPEFKLDNNILTTTEGLILAEVLSDSEFNAVEQIRHDGGISTFGRIESAVIRGGGTRVTTAVTLRYSPVIVKPARDTYIVAGTNIDDASMNYDQTNHQDQSSETPDLDVEIISESRNRIEESTNSQLGDTPEHSIFGEIAIPVVHDEIIYTGTIDLGRVRELQLLGRRWATLVDRETRRMAGFIRIPRLLNKYDAGIYQVHANDPKLHGVEISWNADETELDDAFDSSFVVFCNHLVDGDTQHYILFRHSYNRWQRSRY